MPLTKSEQQVAKDKLRVEFAHRIAKLNGPVYVPTPHHVQAIERQLEDYLNSHLDLIVAFYRDNYPTALTDQEKRFRNNSSTSV